LTQRVKKSFVSSDLAASVAFSRRAFSPPWSWKGIVTSHQENPNLLDRNDRNCLQSQTSFIQLVVSWGFYAF
jgi:hypothetical protein